MKAELFLEKNLHNYMFSEVENGPHHHFKETINFPTFQVDCPNDDDIPFYWSC